VSSVTFKSPLITTVPYSTTNTVTTTTTKPVTNIIHTTIIPVSTPTTYLVISQPNIAITKSDIASTFPSTSISTVNSSSSDANMHTLLTTIGLILSPMVPQVTKAQVSQPTAAAPPLASVAERKDNIIQ